MTISGYSSAIVDTMLGWLKGFANWVLRLFNLAGSASGSPLLWLSHNWLKLLIVFVVVGVAADILVWLVRWRPHWVWFRKERVIVNDDKFFSEGDLMTEADWEEDLEKNWHERDYVVASTVVKRGGDLRERERGADVHESRYSADDLPSTVVRRRDGGERGAGKGSFQRGERRRKPGSSHRSYDEHGVSEAEAKGRRMLAEREADLFGKDGGRSDVTDFYEDEVFNVSNLPSTDDYPFEDEA